MSDEQDRHLRIVPDPRPDEARARLIRTILEGSRDCAFEALAECLPSERAEALREACTRSLGVNMVNEKRLSGHWTLEELFELLAVSLFIEERAHVAQLAQIGELYTLMSNATRETKGVVERLVSAVEVVHRHGPGRNADEKQWLLDQMLHALAGDTYAKVIERLEWSEGVPPRSAS